MVQFLAVCVCECNRFLLCMRMNSSIFFILLISVDFFTWSGVLLSATYGWGSPLAILCGEKNVTRGMRSLWVSKQKWYSSACHKVFFYEPFERPKNTYDQNHQRMSHLQVEKTKSVNDFKKKCFHIVRIVCLWILRVSTLLISIERCNKYADFQLQLMEQ